MQSSKGSIRHELLSYMFDNPDAQDSLEGIVEWWLLEQMIKCGVSEIKEVLEELVTKGLVVEIKGENSVIHYRINNSKIEQIKEMLEQPEQGE